MSIIAVDFDGTLCESRWPEIGDAHWPILHEIVRRQAEGDKFILWTCREGKLLDEAVAWCLNRGIRFDAVNANLPERIAKYGDDPRKLSADEYWDDRAVLIGPDQSLLRRAGDGYLHTSWKDASITCIDAETEHNSTILPGVSGGRRTGVGQSFCMPPASQTRADSSKAGPVKRLWLRFRAWLERLWRNGR